MRLSDLVFLSQEKSPFALVLFFLPTECRFMGNRTNGDDQEKLKPPGSILFPGC